MYKEVIGLAVEHAALFKERYRRSLARGMHSEHHLDETIFMLKEIMEMPGVPERARKRISISIRNLESLKTEE
jgi:hypothetical protein